MPEEEEEDEEEDEEEAHLDSFVVDRRVGSWGLSSARSCSLSAGWYSIDSPRKEITWARV